MTINMHVIYQVVLMLGQVLNLVSGIVPPKYQAFIALGIGLVQAFLGWYVHHYNPDGTPASIAFVAKLILLCLLISSAAMAQDKTPVFSVSQQAVGVRLGGQTVAGSDSIGSYTLMDNSKLGMVQLQSDNLLVPAINLQGYLGGMKLYPSALAKLFAKTTLNVAPYVHGAFGVVRNVPAVGAVKQHYSAIADLGFDYKVNNTLSFGPRIGFFDAPGFGKGPHGAIVSANLTLVLGSK